MYPYYTESDIKSAEKTDVSPDNSQSERIFKLLNGLYNKKLASADKYSYLSDNSDEENTKNILRSIYIEEMKNSALLKDELDKMTDQYDYEIIKEDIPFDYEKPFDQLLKELIIEKAEISRYLRDLSFAVKEYSDELKELLLSMINDEQNHALLDILLYADSIKKE